MLSLDADVLNHRLTFGGVAYFFNLIQNMHQEKMGLADSEAAIFLISIEIKLFLHFVKSCICKRHIRSFKVRQIQNFLARTVIRENSRLGSTPGGVPLRIGSTSTLAAWEPHETQIDPAYGG